MLPNEQALTLESLLPETQKRYDEGKRLVGVSVVDLIEQDAFDLFYHFDKDLNIEHYRLTVDKQAPVPSISGIYFPALLYENEIKDQFGVNFQNILIDFGCTLYLEQEVVKSPFCKFSYGNKLAKEEGV